MQSRSKKTVVIAVVCLLIALAWYVFSPSNPHRDGQTTRPQESSQSPEHYQPRNDLDDEDLSPAGPRHATKPDGGLVYVRGKGWMKKVDDPNAVPPPPKEDLPQKQDTEKPEPLKPVTPAWKLKMKTRLLGDMERRIERIRNALDEARKAGDEEAVHRNEILLERTKMRTKRLRSDVELLKQQASDSQDPNQREVEP